MTLGRLRSKRHYLFSTLPPFIVHPCSNIRLHSHHIRNLNQSLNLVKQNNHPLTMSNILMLLWEQLY